MTLTTATQIDIRKATAADVPALAGTLARAFEDDPVFAWFFAEERRRMQRIERFFDTVLRLIVLKHDETYVGARGAGAALWMPPGTAHLGPVENLRLMPALARVFGRGVGRALRGMSLMEEHHPHDPHEYLWFLGVEPDRQGEGIGSGLLRPMLERLDADGVPAYLEATSERSRDLYLRHGFEVTGELRFPDGPPMWRMWRS